MQKIKPFDDQDDDLDREENGDHSQPLRLEDDYLFPDPEAEDPFEEDFHDIAHDDVEDDPHDRLED